MIARLVRTIQGPRIFSPRRRSRRLLFLLVVLARDPPSHLHLNVTPYPTSASTMRQQLPEACS
jgi:hypothetical protein